MYRHSRDHRRPALRGRYRPAAASGVAADLHDSGDANIGGQPDGFVGLKARVCLRRIEMAV
jgi:hypothetical protein